MPRNYRKRCEAALGRIDAYIDKALKASRTLDRLRDLPEDQVRSLLEELDLAADELERPLFLQPEETAAALQELERRLSGSGFGIAR